MSGRRASWRLSAVAAAAAILASAACEAQVRWNTGPDGRRVLSNEGSKRRPARSASRAAPARLPATDRIDVSDLVNRYAAEFELDPALVHAVIRVESAYNPSAVSHKGAIGLMQLMPQTASDLAVADPFDPEQNVRGGSRYLRTMLDRFDNRLEWALAGYNAGPNTVERYDGIPPYSETIDYVEKVIRLYRGDADFSLPRTIPRYRGRKTYLVREGGRVLMTTSRPAGG